MYIETWYRIACPSCKAINWLNNGDTTDQTVPDIEAFQCHACNHIYRLGDDDEDGEFYEEPFSERGLPTPR